MSAIYLSLLFFSVILSGVGWSKEVNKLNAPFSWFFIYAFSVLLGFRSRFSGVDTMSYFNYFNDVSSNQTPDYSFELGFTYFTFFMTSITSVEIYIFFLTFIQLLSLYLSCKLLNIENKLLCIVLFIVFMPGLDMLTNGLRGGVSLAIGLVVLVATVIKNNRLAALNFLPMLIHASYGILAIISLFTQRFSRSSIHTLLFSLSLFFFTVWVFVNPLSMLAVIEGYSQESNYLGKLVRYLIIEKELMSFSVKIYFIVLSILLSSIYFFTLKVNDKSKKDEVLSRMIFIILSGQFLYALFSFSQYAYRFMFLVYPLQIVMVAYVIDKYFSGLFRNILIYVLLVLGVLSTYTTNSFSSFELLSL